MLQKPQKNNLKNHQDMSKHKPQSPLTKQQQAGCVLLGIIVAITIIFIHFTPHWIKQSPPDPSFFVDYETLHAFDSVVSAKKDSVFKAKYFFKKSHSSLPKTTLHIARSPFDPNTADSLTLLQQGLRPWQVQNILHYRAKGGVFRDKQALKRFNISDSLYALLEPYIQLDTQAINQLPKPTYAKIKKDTILNLNTADTAELQLIRGIGRATAIKIVAYRRQLGGFFSPEQLREIKGITPEQVDSLIPHFFANPSDIQPMLFYRASMERLVHHPYLTYKQADFLYQTKRTHKNIHSWDDLPLPNDTLFTPQDLQRLTYYLDFTPTTKSGK